MMEVARYPITESALRWLENILTERFGHIWRLAQTEYGLRMELEGAEGAIVFDTLQDCLFRAASDQPCTEWNIRREGWQPILDELLPAPGAADLPMPLIELYGTEYTVHYNILGLAYWMLCRVEEIDRTDLDKHQRFPAKSSHASKHGYLERPIVDEWLMILGQIIVRVWPQLKLLQHKFDIKLSHDVDSPSLYAFKSWQTIGRMMAGHLLKRHDLKAFFTAPYVKLVTRTKIHPSDPFNTFDWLMEISEANNLKSAFYFICGRTDPVYDADYDLNHPLIRSLMRHIHQRGHEIGLHPSYAAYLDPELIQQEASRLRQVCAEEGIEQNEWGGRMHYLRWSHPKTLRAWEEAGMSYDSTLGYAERPGYRCGTCHEFPAFDPLKQTQLNLRIKPLILMEGSVIDAEYLGLGISQEAEDKIKTLKEHCRKVNGSFVMLWHNSYLASRRLCSLYKSTIMD